MSKNTELTAAQRKVISQLPADNTQAVQQFMLKFTVLAEACVPINGPTISFPWQEIPKANEQTSIQSFIRFQCNSLVSEIVEHEQENYSFPNGFKHTHQNAKTKAAEIDQTEQFDIPDEEISIQTASRKGNLGKSDYKSYFGKGKQKINPKCCMFLG